jgi:hypothetical protein
MLRSVLVTLIGAILSAGIVVQKKPALEGVWKLTEVSVRRPGEDWTKVTPGASVYIFTKTHYSYTFAASATPRKLFAGDPNSPTDAEKVGAYDSFVAAAGTYVLSGTTLKLMATVHKNPNEMTGEALTYTVELDANGDTLRMTIANAPFAPGRERRLVLTRLE